MFKIESSEYCIADISGDIYNIIKDKKEEKKLFIRPNVALELGMAYGFNKPSLIISREIDGMRSIPSDIESVRWIGISFRDWPSVSQKLLDRLRETEPRELLRKELGLHDKRSNKEMLKQINALLHLKETTSRILSRGFNISKIVKQGDELIGIIKDGAYLREGVTFKLYIITNEIESLNALVVVDHLTLNKIAQLKFIPINNPSASCRDYWKNIAIHFQKNNCFVPDKHRLELIIPDGLEEISSEQLRNAVEILSKVIRMQE